MRESKDCSQDDVVMNDRMLHALVRGTPDPYTRQIIGRIDQISDPAIKLEQIRLAQWDARQELNESFDLGYHYRGTMRVLGLLEEGEEKITGKPNDAWIVWPRVKRVEKELGQTL